MTTGGNWWWACEFGGIGRAYAVPPIPAAVPVTMPTTPVPTAGRRLSARRLHRGQMRTEDPPFLALHLDTDAAPAVDSSHDDAAPDEATPAPTVLKRTLSPRLNWLANASAPMWRGARGVPGRHFHPRAATKTACRSHLPGAEGSGDGVARWGESPDGSRRRAGAASSLRHLGARTALSCGLLPAGRPSRSGEGERGRPASYGVGRVFPRRL